MTGSVLVVAGGVLLALEYDPRPYAPTPERWLAARQIHAFVRELEGEAVLTSLPFVAVRDGKSCTQPSLQAYLDVRRAGMNVSLGDALDASGARWVVTSGLQVEAPFLDELAGRFERVRALDLVLYPGGDASPPTLWTRLRAVDRRDGPAGEVTGVAVGGRR
jgi:hypothetical protein